MPLHLKAASYPGLRVSNRERQHQRHDAGHNGDRQQLVERERAEL
jgi:hypothetical protein